MDDVIYNYEDYKIQICKHCGKEFKLYRRLTDNKYSEKTVCDECLKPEETKTAICKKCGKSFYLSKRKNGKGFNNRQYCDECSKPVQTKTLNCINCGKPFILERDKETGRFPNRKRCDNCQDNKQTRLNKCKICGEYFEVGRTKVNNSFSNQSICDNCSKPLTRIQICKKCGKEFEVSRSSKTGNFLYRNICFDCDDFGKTKFTRICQCCGKEFEVERYNKCQKFQDYIYCKDCIGKPITKICKECGREFESIITSQYRYGYKSSLCLDCHKSDKDASEPENEFFNALLDVFDSKQIIREQTLYYNDKNFYIYDFAIKDTNILIEINPTYTHSIEYSYFGNGKDKNYHYNKTNEAVKQGYHCINVWQWDDINKIVNIIKPKQKLYARKLKINIIDKYKANNFLDKYHLQNSCYGNIINLGLFLDNDIIQVMTFGKPRYNKNYEWELLRLCTHSDYYVIGGAERLFKHFVEEYSPQSIISYCDTSKFTGDVYNRLGFELLRKTQPQKIWSKSRYEDKSHITDNLLRQRGYDQLFNTNYGKGTDNEQLMLDNGWLPVYDCGQKVFIWQNKEE